MEMDEFQNKLKKLKKHCKDRHNKIKLVKNHKIGKNEELYKFDSCGKNIEKN